jgi:ceramide glucosyltransferase
MYVVRRFVEVEIPQANLEIDEPRSVSQLKPVHGQSPRLESCLVTALDQEYPAPWEVVFSAGQEDDPALDLAKSLPARVPVQVVGGGVEDYTNPKVCSMMAGEPYLRNDWIVCWDADMRAPRDFLKRVFSPFRDPEVGASTALYGVKRVDNFGQALEGLSVTDFGASVLVARVVEGMSFMLGAVLAFRREVLDQVGGFGVVRHHLADDYQLGNRTHKAGWKVALSPCIVEDVLGERSFGEYWEHQLRWMRTYRVCRPGGHAAFIITQGLVWSLLWVLISGGSSAAWQGLGCWLLIRFFSTRYVWRMLGSASAARWALITPYKDLCYFALWVASWFGKTVRWGGKDYVLGAGGTMRRART